MTDAPRRPSTGSMRAVGVPIEMVDEAGDNLREIVGEMTAMQVVSIRKVLLNLGWATYNAGFERGRASPPATVKP